MLFQHAAARRRLKIQRSKARCQAKVSTRSRPKAADTCFHIGRDSHSCFNTQPPEGG